ATQAAAASARATRARQSPATVANRIRRLEADARQLHRRIDQCDTESDHGRQLQADLDDLDDQIAYWSGIRREQIATGQATDFDQSMIDPGDLVKVSGSWWKVRRANRTTVTLESGGCSIRSPYSSIQTHRRAATQDRPERSD